MTDRPLADLIHESGLPPDTPITDLPGLTWHATRPLTNRDVQTLGQLAQLADDDIRAIPGIGPRRLDAIKTAVKAASPKTPPAPTATTTPKRGPEATHTRAHPENAPD